MSFDCGEINFQHHTNTPELNARPKAASGPQPEHYAGPAQMSSPLWLVRLSSCEGRR